MATGGTNFSEKGLRDEQIMQAFGCVDGVDGSELLVTRGLFIALGCDGVCKGAEETWVVCSCSVRSVRSAKREYGV